MATLPQTMRVLIHGTGALRIEVGERAFQWLSTIYEDGWDPLVDLSYQTTQLGRSHAEVLMNPGGS